MWDRGCPFITSHSNLFQPESADIFGAVGRHFGIDPALIEQHLYADTPEERRISFDTGKSAHSPRNIVAALNLRRLQQRLRRAIGMTLHLSRNVQHHSPFVDVLWALKRNRLMYDVAEEGRSLMFTITGPYNLFEKTTVYGNRLADFVQALLRIASHEWRAAVEILVPHLNRQANSIEVVRLDGTLQRFFADAPAQLFGW